MGDIIAYVSGLDISEINSLHENALVAWDRDGMTIPDYQSIRIHFWAFPRWSMIGISNDDAWRDDGIGAIAGTDKQGKLFRRVLYKADNDLGVSWWADNQ